MKLILALYSGPQTAYPHTLIFPVLSNKKSNLISSNERQHVLRITNDTIEALRLHGIKEWHFLTETISYWSENIFSTESFNYFNDRNIVSRKNVTENPICWDILFQTENYFDNAIKWYGVWRLNNE